MSKKPLTFTNENITINNKSSANMDIKVSIFSIINKPGNEVTIEGAVVGILATINKPGANMAIENTVVGILATINKPSTNTAIKNIAVSIFPGYIELVSSKVIIDTL